MALRVSDLARSAGVSSDTIRYYERLGLLPQPERSVSGYRQYGAEDARRVRFIKDAQRIGLSLSDIGELLKIRDEGACPCGHTKVLVDRRLEQLNDEIARLRRLRDELAALSEIECIDIDGSCWLCGPDEGR